MILKKYKKKTYKNNKSKRRYTSDLSGEDIAMFNERTMDERNKKRKNICDTHQDGV